MPFEFSILNSIQEHMGCKLLDTVMPLISGLGDLGIIWIVSCLIMLCFRKTRKAGKAMALALILEALFCNLLLKPLAARVRPCDVNAAFPLLIARPTDFSFPSGHASAAFAAAASLFFIKNRLALPYFVFAILISFSRLYLYVHYPTDVLAGALIGIVFGWIGAYIVINQDHGGINVQKTASGPSNKT